MDFRVTLTPEEHDRWNGIAKHYRAVHGVRNKSAVFRLMLTEEEKRTALEQMKAALK